MQINNISISFGNNIVLDDISYDFSNRCSLLLGENGSGKTTLFKILGGIIKKYNGQISDINNSSLLLDEDCLFKYKTGEENINYFLNDVEINKAMEYVIYFSMEGFIKNKVKTYSSGMKKKLSLVITLARNKEFVLLDEPTNSLDIGSIELLRGLLNKLKEDKHILISSHDISIFDKNLIDDVLLLKNHKLSRINKLLFDFNYYKVKTVKPILKIEYDFFISEDYYIFKVNENQYDDFLLKLGEYTIKELYPIDYFDSLFLGDLYEKDI